MNNVAAPFVHTTVNRFLTLKPRLAYVWYAVMDTLCAGIGMGVPAFNIILGFFVGWYIVKSLRVASAQVESIVTKILPRALYTSLFTLLLMSAIWGPAVARLFDPGVNHAAFGIPMILYEAKASFVGWLLLMILISPLLQLLTTLGGAHLALLGVVRNQTQTVQK